MANPDVLHPVANASEQSQFDQQCWCSSTKEQNWGHYKK